MSVIEALLALAAALLGGFLASVISARQERWKFRQERQAVKEDRQAAKADKLDEIQTMLAKFTAQVTQQQTETENRLQQMRKVDDAQSQALKLLLLDRILHLGQAYIERGWLTLDEKNNLTDLHICYHDTLQGNGNADNVMKAVEHLEVRAHHERRAEDA